MDGHVVMVGATEEAAGTGRAAAAAAAHVLRLNGHSRAFEYITSSLMEL